MVWFFFHFILREDSNSSQTGVLHHTIRVASDTQRGPRRQHSIPQGHIRWVGFLRIFFWKTENFRIISRIDNIANSTVSDVKQFVKISTKVMEGKTLFIWNT